MSAVVETEICAEIDDPDSLLQKWHCVLGSDAMGQSEEGNFDIESRQSVDIGLDELETLRHFQATEFGKALHQRLPRILA